MPRPGRLAGQPTDASDTPGATAPSGRPSRRASLGGGVAQHVRCVTQVGVVHPSAIAVERRREGVDHTADGLPKVAVRLCEELRGSLASWFRGTGLHGAEQTRDRQADACALAELIGARPQGVDVPTDPTASGDQAPEQGAEDEERGGASHDRDPTAGGASPNRGGTGAVRAQALP